jgi:hypothetical protein
MKRPLLTQTNILAMFLGSGVGPWLLAYAGVTSPGTRLC